MGWGWVEMDNLHLGFGDYGRGDYIGMPSGLVRVEIELESYWVVDFHPMK